MKNSRYLFLFTILFFALGFINIHFSLLGLICMSLPFVLLFWKKKKVWCQGYCPRAALYTTCGKIKSKHSRATPAFFIKGNMKWIMLGYFVISLVMIVMSTIKVANGAIPPMNHLRFLLAVPLAGNLPQLVHFDTISPWITHLSFRFYSMMMTTTVLGLLLALFYKPRTWCTICPISTISTAYIKGKNN